MASRYEFRKVAPDDLSLITEWHSRPHVREWWDADETYDLEEIRDPRVSRWIVSFDRRPFAFMQDYTVHGWEVHHFSQLPSGSRGIDQFIGEPDMMERGHGSAFIGARIRALFDAGAPVVATGIDITYEGKSVDRPREGSFVPRCDIAWKERYDRFLPPH